MCLNKPAVLLKITVRYQELYYHNYTSDIFGKVACSPDLNGCEPRAAQLAHREASSK